MPGRTQQQLARRTQRSEIQGRPESAASFPAQVAVTEAILLGCIAQRLPGVKLAWDTGAMAFTNCKEANQYVDPPYRAGWEV